jgi:L-aspartate oxidase
LFSLTDSEYNILKIISLVLTCRLIIQSALIREESRGGHIREDFPYENPEFRVHIVQKKNLPPEFDPVKD